jgi:uncharacterized protein YbjQ (UPF0145 family)
MTNILITTTPTVENRPVREYLGIVSGIAFMAHWRLYSQVGDYNPDTLDDPDLGYLLGKAVYEWENFKAKFHEAQNRAIQQMTKKAESLGANAVTGVKIDYKTIDSSQGARAMILIATGTAVRL